MTINYQEDRGLLRALKNDGLTEEILSIIAQDWSVDTIADAIAVLVGYGQEVEGECDIFQFKFEGGKWGEMGLDTSMIGMRVRMDRLRELLRHPSQKPPTIDWSVPMEDRPAIVASHRPFPQDPCSPERVMNMSGSTYRVIHPGGTTSADWPRPRQSTIVSEY